MCHLKMMNATYTKHLIGKQKACIFELYNNSRRWSPEYFVIFSVPWLLIYLLLVSLGTISVPKFTLIFFFIASDLLIFKCQSFLRTLIVVLLIIVENTDVRKYILHETMKLMLDIHCCLIHSFSVIFI